MIRCFSIACIGTPNAANVTEYVIAEVGCVGKTIIDFVSNSPVGLRKSTIQNPSTGQSQMNTFSHGFMLVLLIIHMFNRSNGVLHS